MYTSITVENFRGFRQMTVAPLQRVNLIVAKNNVGKTAFLEAITLLVNGIGALQTFPQAFRGAAPPELGYEFWAWLFYGRRLESEVNIVGQTKAGTGTEKVQLRCSSSSIADFRRCDMTFQIADKEQRYIYIRTEPEMKPQNAGPRNRNGTSGGAMIFSTNPMNPVEESRKYHRVMLKKGGEERVQSLLKIIDPRLTKIRPAQLGAQPSIYADVGLDELIPVSQLGQGFARVLSIYASLFLSEAKVFLIDELENGIHYSALDQVWRGVAEVAEKENVQVFATTHSWECIAAAQRVFAQREPYDFAVHRLESVDGTILAKTYDKEALATSIESRFEVR